MHTVDDIMSESVHLVAGHASVKQAAQEMARLNISVLVILEEGKIAGVLSEAELSKQIITRNLPAESTRVSDIMTKSVLCLRSGASVLEACEVFREKNTTWVLVVNDDAEPVGMLTALDVIHFFSNNDQISALYDGG